MPPRSADPDDRRLVDQFLRRRSERSFRALYRRHTPALYQLTLRLLAGREKEAEEVIQEMWMRAVHRLQEFRGDSKLSTWLSGIAINCCRENLRRRQRDSWEELPEIPEIPFAEGIDRLALEEAIASLPDGFRTVLVLHDVEHYTHEEIGKLLGIASGTSKSQLSRARRAVRHRLADSKWNASDPKSNRGHHE